MKRIFTLCVALCTFITGFTQVDTTGRQNDPGDTIRIGGMIIIRKPGSKERQVIHDNDYRIRSRNRRELSNISTNWWILDLGFSSFKDNTNYASPAAQQYAPGSNPTWFDLKDGKSVNVNLWFFMQRPNLIKHVVNLKYGLGIELNNYRYKQKVIYDPSPMAVLNPPIVSLDATPNRNYEKDKLAADYLTVPILLNFNITPRRNEGFGFSAGISAGYLYSARNKTVTSDQGKKKARDDFELNKWKLSYIAELSLGPVRFYGSLAMKNMYERGLDMTPYNFGFRFSNW